MLDDDLRRLVEAIQVLAGDVQFASRLSCLNDSQFARRAYVRAAFALVEGSLNLMADVILAAAIRNELELTSAETAVLRQEQVITGRDRRTTVRVAFVPIRVRLSSVFTLFSRLYGTSFVVDKSTSGWRTFTTAIEIRNRITHPKAQRAFAFLMRIFRRLSKRASGSQIRQRHYLINAISN
jgi:hypothetical protein